jgi:hypothetical protein
MSALVALLVINAIAPGKPSHKLLLLLPQVRLAVFSQHHVDGLDLALNPLQIMLNLSLLLLLLSSQVRLAVFSQHHVDGLDLALNPLQIMLNAYAHTNLKEQEARAHLGSFGVSGPLALQPMYTLSGGQKSRVALAKVC